MRDLSVSRRTAAQLAISGVDVNELEKLLAYYRRVRDGGKFRTLVERLASQDIFVYSKQTKRHMNQVRSVLLKVLPTEPCSALWFLGWTRRFMRYYAEHEDEAGAVLGKARPQPKAASMGPKSKGGRW